MEWVFLWLWAFSSNGWFALGFFYLELEPYHKMAMNFNYLPGVVYILAFVFVLVMPKKKVKKTKES